MANVHSMPVSVGSVEPDLRHQGTQTVPSDAIYPRGIELSVGSYVHETTTTTTWRLPTSTNAVIEMTKTIRQARIPGTEYNKDPNVREFTICVEYNVKTITMLSTDKKPPRPSSAPGPAYASAPHPASGSAGGSAVSPPQEEKAPTTLRVPAPTVDAGIQVSPVAPVRPVTLEGQSDDVEYVGRISAPVRGRVVVIDSDSDVPPVTRSLRLPARKSAPTVNIVPLPAGPHLPAARPTRDATTRVVRRNHVPGGMVVIDSSDSDAEAAPRLPADSSDSSAEAAPRLPAARPTGDAATPAMRRKYKPMPARVVVLDDTDSDVCADRIYIRPLQPKTRQAVLEQWYPKKTLSSGFTTEQYTELLAKFRAEDEEFQRMDEDLFGISRNPSTPTAPVSTSTSASSVQEAPAADQATGAAAARSVYRLASPFVERTAAPKTPDVKRSPNNLGPSRHDSGAPSTPDQLRAQYMAEKRAGKRRAVSGSASPELNKRIRSEL